MDIKEYLSQEGLTEELCESILLKCAKENKYLSLYMKKRSWKDLPLKYIREAIDAYNKCSINILTGEILEPHRSLIFFNTLTLDMVVKFTGFPNAPSDNMQHTVVVTGVDKNGHNIFATLEDDSKNGIYIDIPKDLNEKGNVNVTINIDTTKINDKVNKINVYYFLDKTNPKVKYERLDFYTLKNGATEYLTDISNVINLNKAVLVFTIEKKGVSWTTRNLCLPTTRTIKQIMTI